MNYQKITTTAAAFKACKLDPKNLPGVSKLPKKFSQWIIDTYTMAIVTQALNLNEDGTIWEPDYSNNNQIKYEARFVVNATKKNPGGVGFSSSDYDYWCTYTDVGARLVFRDYERLSHAQKHFNKIFKGMLLISVPVEKKETKKIVKTTKAKK